MFEVPIQAQIQPWTLCRIIRPKHKFREILQSVLPLRFGTQWSFFRFNISFHILLRRKNKKIGNHEELLWKQAAFKARNQWLLSSRLTQVTDGEAISWE